MKESYKIAVLGDIHGRWRHLNELIAREKPSMIFQCGDFGFWPNMDRKDLSKIENNGIPIYWCDGNHEDHWSLRDRDADEIAPDVTYMPRGSTMELPDGRLVLFFGGADSIDKYRRTTGLDWFPEEVATQKDMFVLDEIDRQVDVVISHTAPKEFLEIDPSNTQKVKDPTREILSYVLHTFKPKLWYFAHWHFAMQWKHEECCWTCLNMAARENWWTWLK